MKGIHVYTRSYENKLDLRDQHTVGVDRRRVIDAALAKVPASVRPALAKKIGRALEVDFDKCPLVAADAVAGDDYAAAWIRPCEVIS